MFGYFNGSSLMRCTHCGRTMRPEALAKHQKLCTAENPMKGGTGVGGGGGAGAAAAAIAARSAAGGIGGGAGGGAGGAPSEYADEEQVLEECAHCGRKMRAEALAKHNRVCTADKPMKPIRSSGAAAPSAPAVSAGAASGSSAAAGSGGSPPVPAPPSVPRPGGGAPRRGSVPGGHKPGAAGVRGALHVIM